jgi:ABC-type uncharacterized transport system involved in gliding motility auxiliary subunit
MNRRTLSAAALGLAALLFIALNVFSQAVLHNARLDLTADRLYTLSPGTRNILAGLKEPVTLRLFFSERLTAAAPSLRTYAQRVRELLEAYANQAGGMIRLEVIDPEPFSDAEDRAVQAGIQGAALDQTSGQSAYFGLVGTNSTDHQEVIPFFQQERERFLEYDLTKLVYTLTDPKKPVVGVLSDMDLTYGPGGVMAAMRGDTGGYAFLRQLRQLFDVRILKTDLQAIEKDISVLLIARPQKLTESALYAVDQYLLGGGKALVLVDPWVESVSDAPGPGGMPAAPVPHAATLPKLFAAWGLELDEQSFVADPKLAIRVTSGEGGRRRALPYPAWLALTASEMSRDDVVSADLTGLNLASAGALRKAKDSPLTLTPLLLSSPQAQMLPVAKLAGPPEPEAMLAGLPPTGGEARILAARVSGTLRTAFPDGPPGTKAEGEKPVHLTKSTGPVNLIVVADTDLLEDRFWAQEQNFLGQRIVVPFAGNADLVANALDNLSGSGDLIGLRGRSGSARPFLAVEELRRSASQQFLAREQALRKKLEQTEKQIQDLQSKTKAGSSALLSAEEQSAVERFRAEVLQTRKELREVQRNLNRDIDRLEASLKGINIGLMPLLVAGYAIGIAGWRVRRRRLRLERE